MTKIKFQHNWNGKLDQKIFTTIRKATEDKLKYYADNVGQCFEVYLNEQQVGVAELISVELSEYVDLPWGFLAVDTGTKDFDEVFQKFGLTGSTKAIILTFEDMESQDVEE